MVNEYKNRIKELEDQIEELQQLVLKDELTGILNRKGIKERLDLMFKEALDSKEHPDSARKHQIQNLSTIFIDIDGFKKVNDTYGHDTGDQVLKGVAEMMKKEVRDNDLVGRLGGEEFVLGLLYSTEDEAYDKAEEIRKKIKHKSFMEEYSDLHITISVGVASVKKSNAQDIMELIDMADKAMYEAKTNRGKDNTVRFSEIAESI